VRARNALVAGSAAVVLLTAGTVASTERPAKAASWTETCILGAKRHGHGRARIIETHFSQGPLYRVTVYTLCSPDYHAVYQVKHQGIVLWRHTGKDHHGHPYHYHEYGHWSVHVDKKGDRYSNQIEFKSTFQLRLPCDPIGRRRMVKLDVRGHLIGADHFDSVLYNDSIYTRPLTYKYECWNSGGGPW
jgi:hypothetical protein